MIRNTTGWNALLKVLEFLRELQHKYHKYIIHGNTCTHTNL